MTKENTIKLFESKKVRVLWDDSAEKWYFSVIDIIEILSESKNPRRYWSDLKIKLNKEGSQLYEKIVQLKMVASDGKMRDTDAADTEQILRLIQSIPSPKAEPFKMWLAKVGYERIEETEDPELAIDRAMEMYLKKGYSTNWINISYNQIFRNGAIELYSQHFHDIGDENEPGFYGSYFEEQVLIRVKESIDFYNLVGIAPPYVISMSLWGMLDRAMDPLSRYYVRPIGFSKSEYRFPSLTIMLPMDIDKHMRELFDVLWQSAGFAKRPNYTPEGKRIYRQ